MNYTKRSSRTDKWTEPRPHTDPGLRRHHYGDLQPMDESRGFSWGAILLGFAIALSALVLAVAGLYASEAGRAVMSEVDSDDAETPDAP